MEQFNGYSNYPTWIVTTYLQEEKKTQGFWTMREEELTREELIKELRLQIEEIQIPLNVKGSIYRDLLGYAMDLINWDEVVDTLKEEDK